MIKKKDEVKKRTEKSPIFSSLPQTDGDDTKKTFSSTSDEVDIPEEKNFKRRFRKSKT